MISLTRVFLNLIFLFLVFCIFVNCATSNCYTARTLEKGKMVLTPGVDNIAILAYSNDGETWGTFGRLSPTIGVSYGLPLRLETGIRYYIPLVVEGNLRFQVNPKSFNAFDLSFNFHPGIRWDDFSFDKSVSYLKYGLTLGKNINGYEPFVGFYRYSSDFSIQYSEYEDRRLSWSMISLGIGLPRDGDIVIPEINFQIYDNNFNNGVVFFGLGVRALIR